MSTPTYETIAKRIDHSLLGPTLTPAELEAGCRLAAAYNVASVCIKPAAVPLAARVLMGTTVAVGTTIGFPHGGHRTDVKVFEAERAMDDGATELDMVINIGDALGGRWDDVRADIRAVVDAAHGRSALVKVIFENCYLSPAEIVRLCHICGEVGADYVKTSTGYGTGGATHDDLKLMRDASPPHVKLKAAGGVRTLDQAIAVVELGCDRFGASRTAEILDELKARLAGHPPGGAVSRGTSGHAGDTDPAPPPAARPDVLAVHGLGGCPDELAPLVAALREAGHRVETITLPGHAPGPRAMPASRWQDWERAVFDAFDRLDAGRGAVAVVGFSTGGTLALDLAIRRPVFRLVLLAPFLAIRHTARLPAWSLGWMPALARLVPGIPRRRPPVRDPAMRAWYAAREPFRTFSLRATCSALDLIARVRPEVGAITAPTLILQGRRDSVVDPPGAAWLLRNLGSAEKRLVVLPNSDHLVALDLDRLQVVDEVLAFLDPSAPRSLSEPATPMANENPTALESYRRYWIGEALKNRGLLLAAGAGCVVLGLVAVFLPVRLFKSVVKVVGGLLIGSGLLKGLQFAQGRRGCRRTLAGWGLIAGQVALDLAMGGLLLGHQYVTAWVLALGLGLMFLAEGALLFVMGVRAATVRGRMLLWLAAAAMGGMALAIFWPGDPSATDLAGLLVGIKLLMFGSVLLGVAFRGFRAGDPTLYDEPIVVPEPGELYAVYFGGAFHLGVAVDAGHVVHYLDDNLVHHATWETFLEGRTPHHWSYPDLPPVPVETVVATALAEVGKTYPYSFLHFNCEHFAIFCKSGGAVKDSIYAQSRTGFRNVATHPIVGLVAELNTRLVEFLAFHLGGPSGKSLSLAIRRIGGIVNAWLLSKGRPAPTS